MSLQSEHFHKNLSKYKKEHPGEWLVLYPDLSERFFKIEEDYNKEMRKYHNTPEPNPDFLRIPLQKKNALFNLLIMPEFNKTETARLSYMVMDHYKDSFYHTAMAQLILDAKPYTGRFLVYKNDFLSRGGFIEGLPKRKATLLISEERNIHAILFSSPLYAYLEWSPEIIKYTPKQILSREKAKKK